MADIFNDYNEFGYRATMYGNKSTRIEDQAILRNIREHFPNETANLSDQAVVNAYDEFAVSEMFGNNDELFPEFLLTWEAQ